MLVVWVPVVLVGQASGASSAAMGHYELSNDGVWHDALLLDLVREELA